MRSCRPSNVLGACVTVEKSNPNDRYLIALSESWGCLDAVEKGDAGICAIQPLMFTHAIYSGMNLWGYEDRWCYKTYKDAKAALDAWDGAEGTEPTGWHRHPKTGRRVNEDGSTEVCL